MVTLSFDGVTGRSNCDRESEGFGVEETVRLICVFVVACGAIASAQTNDDKSFSLVEQQLGWYSERLIVRRGL